jgi:uncharacterized protein DUF3168
VSLEGSIFAALKTLVDNRVYRPIAPANVTTLPRITFQQVGGESLQFLHADGTAEAPLPSKQNARIQINVWHSKGSEKKYDAALELARQVRDAIVKAPGLQARVLGEAVAIHEEETDLVGTMQDFSVWYDA